jgi:DNA repair protein RadA/Sms
VEEPGADLPVALALASAARGVPLAPGSGEERGGPAETLGPAASGAPRPLAAYGEIGLTGELRHVAHAERRTSEAVKFGLAPVMAPGPDARTLRAALGAVLGREERRPRAA